MYNNMDYKIRLQTEKKLRIARESEDCLHFIIVAPKLVKNHIGFSRYRCPRIAYPLNLGLFFSLFVLYYPQKG